jgi:hypothetical protein
MNIHNTFGVGLVGIPKFLLSPLRFTKCLGVRVTLRPPRKKKHCSWQCITSVSRIPYHTMDKYGRMYTGFIWHRIGTSGRVFEHIKLLIKVRGFLFKVVSLYDKNKQP